MKIEIIMNKNITYTVEDFILIRKFSGDVTINELISSLKYMINENLITQNLKGIISDFSEAMFLVEDKELLLLKDLFVKYNDILGVLRFAQIITTPKIVRAMIFKSENPDVKTQSFSTMQAARNWINSRQ